MSSKLELISYNIYSINIEVVGKYRRCDFVVITSEFLLEQHLLQHLWAADDKKQRCEIPKFKITK